MKKTHLTRRNGVGLSALATLGVWGMIGCAPARVGMTAPSQSPLLLSAAPSTFPASDPPAEAPPAGSDEAKARASFETVARVIGVAGVYKTPGVYQIQVPRDDLSPIIEGMPVPFAAGLESTFFFYYCPCGKTNVVGVFCVLEYELNDVIDALRAARIEVVSIAPMLLHVKQMPMAVRFQAEGKPEPIAAAIKEALRWMGKERMKKLDMEP